MVKYTEQKNKKKLPQSLTLNEFIRFISYFDDVFHVLIAVKFM